MKCYCPSCTACIKIPEKRANTKGKCPSCGQVFVLVPSKDNLPVIVQPTRPELLLPALIKNCPFCSESIATTAVKCKHCNEFLDGRSVPVLHTQQPIIIVEEPKKSLKKSKQEFDQIGRQQPQSHPQQQLPQRAQQPQQTLNISQVVNVGLQQQRWSRIVAGVLSLVFPGLGHLYKGQIISGFVWAILVVGGYILFVIPGVILHMLCFLGSMTGNTSR